MMGGSRFSRFEIVHQTPKCLVAKCPVNMFQMNQYFIGCKQSKKSALLDAGDTAVDDWKQAFCSAAGSAEENKNFLPFDKVLQTHCHLDHIAGLPTTMKYLQQQHQELSKKKGAAPAPEEEDVPPVPKVIYHRGEQVWLNGALEGFGPMGMSFPDLYNLPKPGNVVIPAEMKAEVEDGDAVSVGDLVFKVIHVPGHTPGQVVFFCASEKIAFVGDLIFEGSIGRTDFPNCEPEKMGPSLEKLYNVTNSDDVALFSGHGNPTTTGKEKQHNPYIQQLFRGGRSHL